ncbi:MAG: glycine oxidase ThiO [Gloeocapsa sp. DLM2.Bin57]|nr:MAG: glycine oxidase ThiO [Gloeocapsa sp. DLM2.Bin57]
MQKTTEILIIGAGINGLAIAIDLKLRGATVKILSRNPQEVATLAAAGMLAPGAEQLPPGPLAELAERSRWLYPEWVRKIEELTQLNVGYWSCGILAPVYTTPESTEGFWLDREGINLIQPGLGTEVVGGYCYPEDGQVDPRELYKALLKAVEILEIELIQGITVEAIAQRQGKVESVRTKQGDFYAETYVLTAGAWSSQLYPLPVYPVKGQMLALQMPSGTELPLQRVLYGPQTYLVPRQSGRLIVGATSEKVGYQANNTPQGIKTLLNNAIRLYPTLQDWSIESFWSGFRPGTPDELPILGKSNCDNLILATGHYRNGILLAPVTASIIANLIINQQSDPLLTHFNCDRFYRPVSKPMTALIPSTPSIPTLTEDQLQIAGKTFRSRLLTGTGKYPNIPTMQASIESSGCEIVTVAVRRVQTKAPGHEGLAETIDWQKIWMLPNTAGCKTAEEAIRVARLGREMAKLVGQEDNNFVKLEVIPDPKYLLPDPIETLKAASQLVKEGFAVLPYINADPLLAKRLEEAGCVTVMPLGSPIGSGQGIRNAANIAIIIEQANVPVVVDAGIGTPSEATLAMEMGADAVLINSAIALAKDPPAMAKAMGMATVAGRIAYVSGRMPVKDYASASSPLTGTVG